MLRNTTFSTGSLSLDTCKDSRTLWSWLSTPPAEAWSWVICVYLDGKSRSPSTVPSVVELPAACVTGARPNIRTLCTRFSELVDNFLRQIESVYLTCCPQLILRAAASQGFQLCLSSGKFGRKWNAEVSHSSFYGSVISGHFGDVEEVYLSEKGESTNKKLLSPLRKNVHLSLRITESHFTTCNCFWTSWNGLHMRSSLLAERILAFQSHDLERSGWLSRQYRSRNSC